jgi:hypothetical protein
MAWIEQTGERSWRVRYPRTAGGYGSESGFRSPKAARDYANDLESDRRRGQWLDPDGGKTHLAAWADRWIDTVDVEPRTEENYRGYLRNHILPRWATTPLGAISALEVTAWFKTLRAGYAASTVSCIVTVFSMMLDDAIDEHLIPTSPIHRHRRCGRRRSISASMATGRPASTINAASTACRRGVPTSRTCPATRSSTSPNKRTSVEGSRGGPGSLGRRLVVGSGLFRRTAAGR